MEMTQTGYDLVVGIDVSKAKLDIVLGSQGSVETIDSCESVELELSADESTSAFWPWVRSLNVSGSCSSAGCVVSTDWNDSVDSV